MLLLVLNLLYLNKRKISNLYSNSNFKSTRKSGSGLAGKGEANPTAMLLTGANMLSAMGYQRFSKLIESAVINVYEEGRVLPIDVGGKANTQQFTDRVIKEVEFLNDSDFRYGGHISQ